MPTSGDGQSWVCPACTLENPLDAGQCLACGNQNRDEQRKKAKAKMEAEPVRPPRSKKPWTCAKCTLENAAADSTCVACDAPKPSSSASANARPRPPSTPCSDTKCPVCTFENKARAAACEMCGTVLNNNNNVGKSKPSKVRNINWAIHSILRN